MMVSKVLEIISHIKNVSKQKVSYEKILPNLEKRESSISMMTNSSLLYRN